MEVTLSEPKQVVINPAITKTVEKVTVIQLVDQPIHKRVMAVTREVGNVMLWEGEQYDEIGQWTDAQARSRLQEVIQG